MNFLSRLKIREKLLLGFAIIGLFFILSSVHTLTQISEINENSRTTAEINAPAWDAIMEAKVEILMGHLWLKEAMTGSTSISKEKIFGHWQKARWYGEALLHGNEKEGVKYNPIESPEVRKTVTNFLKDLDGFSALAGQRYQLHITGQTEVENTLEKEFNEKFEILMADLTVAEDEIAKIIADGNKHSLELIEAENFSVIVGLILILFIGFLIAMYISQYVVARPLNKIVNIVQNIAGGDLTKTARVESKDEVGMMAEAINTMSEKLSLLMSRVQQSGIQIASSVTEIAASTKEQEATATEHAATTNQIAASVKEISATSKQLGHTTENVTQLALGTASSASDGQIMLNSLDSTMNRMAKASGSIADKFADLNEKASNIGNMVTTINKVADQTNLLSLNAAIEAEKAGEYGRGFAVVATEIRRLADQTAVATYDIEQMVSEVQSAISAGVMSMDKFSEEINSSVDEAKKAGVQLEKIIQQTQALAPHFESVNEGLQAQVEGAEQINEAMMNLSEAAQQTAEFVRHSNDAINELNDAAHGMREGIAIFKVSS
jgi:methyl-accepting chemotaxis protein WspA